MERDDSVLLGHMLEVAKRIADRFRDLSREQYDLDDELRDAIAYRIQIIGEAASKLSPQFRASHCNLPWAQIIGLRHRIVHDYMNVNYKILWEVVKKDIPKLIEALEPLVCDD